MQMDAFPPYALSNKSETPRAGFILFDFLF